MVRRDMLGGAAARGVMVAGCPVSKTEQSGKTLTLSRLFGDVKPKAKMTADDAYAKFASAVFTKPSACGKSEQRVVGMDPVFSIGYGL